MIISTRKSLFVCPFLLAATLTVGFGIVWCVVTIWIVESLLIGTRASNWENIVIASDGTPLISTQHMDANSQIAFTYRDLKDQPHADVPYLKQLKPTQVSGLQNAPRPLSEWNQRLKVFLDDSRPTTVWYLVHDGQFEGSAYLVGYDRPNNRLIGYLGMSGLKQRPLSKEELIPIRGESMLYLANWSSVPINILYTNYNLTWPDRLELPARRVYIPSGKRLLLADLGAGTIVPVFETPEPIISVGVPTIASWTGGDAVKDRSILVRLPRKIYALNQEHKITREFNLSADIPAESAVSWYDLEGGQTIVNIDLPRHQSMDAVPTDNRSIVYRLKADGSIQESTPLALNSGLRTNSHWWEADLIFGVGFPAPLPLLVMTVGQAVIGNDGTSVQNHVLVLLRRFWKVAILVMLASAVLATLAWLRGKAFGLSEGERLSWAIFVFLLGLPGFAGFLLARRWPPRIPCPSCQAPAPRDREVCAACHTAFPAPAAKGIEIFA